MFFLVLLFIEGLTYKENGMTVSFRATDNSFHIQNKSTKYDKNLPIKSAVVNTAVFTGIGLGCDYLLLNKLLKIKTTRKEALIINGLFGLGIGILSFFQTKKMQKTDNIKNVDDMIEDFVNKNS